MVVENQAAAVDASAVRIIKAIEPQTKQKKPRSFWQAFPEASSAVHGVVGAEIPNRSCRQKEELNQYWYSKATVEALAREIVAETALTARVAFLSTPSVYFALKPTQEYRELVLFDFDDKFQSEGDQFVPFDFRAPERLPNALHGSFDLLVIDPPFISREVWELYAQAARLLARPGAKILLTTIQENAELIRELLACSPQVFRPSIPHLVYQYALFANYASTQLSARNPEVPDDL